MNPALLIIAACTAITINLVQHQRDLTDFNQAIKPPTIELRYDCTASGLKNMLADQLEDETIKTICRAN